MRAPLTPTTEKLKALQQLIDETEALETFGDDERLAREHAQHFYEEYPHDGRYLP
jgi:hypothetical protein